MPTEPEIQGVIIEDLKTQGYFSITDNGAKNRIRSELAEKYKVDAVWIKDVVVNGYGKDGRRIEDSKIIEILGSDEENTIISKTSEDPAEGTATFADHPATVFFVSSAPSQVGIGLLKIMRALKSEGVSGLIILNNGNSGPLTDNEFNENKETFDKLGIYMAGVYNGGISHKPNMLKLSSPILERGCADLQLVKHLTADMVYSGLSFTPYINMRTAAALLTKRFLILTGLSGSGKTKLAQAFARWLTPGPEFVDTSYETKGKKTNPYYKVVSVGADWSGNENILGYPNGLHPKEYITKPALELILHAANEDHKDDPHFLILDEMNLSHVERYFADILSAIESDEKIHLHRDEERNVGGDPIEQEIDLPKNLFIIGTVNIDETTHMFSPKVLDRANVIEFRMDAEELEAFLENPLKPDLNKLDGKGEEFAQDFVKAAKNPAEVPEDAKLRFQCEMLLFFKVLQEHGAEFGYRVTHEAGRFLSFYKQLGSETDVEKWFKEAFDSIVVQKFLPKLHGSESKLRGVLFSLAHLCSNKQEWDGSTLEENKDKIKTIASEIFEKVNNNSASGNSPTELEKKLKAEAKAPHYPLSFEKIVRMWRAAQENGFASFAES